MREKGRIDGHGGVMWNLDMGGGDGMRERGGEREREMGREGGRERRGFCALCFSDLMLMIPHEASTAVGLNAMFFVCQSTRL